jgi:hypothetical protein
MSSRAWDATADAVTTPAQIEREAFLQIRLLDGERILRVWKTGRGYLVMTNLRCTEVSRKPQVFSPSDWEAGPNFFFYDLAPPRVEFHRFLRLSEEKGKRGAVLRLFLHDPDEVAQEIQTARLAGQNEWLKRRARSEAAIRRAQERWETAVPFAGRDGVKPVIRVRCGYCGNLVDASASRCPYCGAPQR